MSALPSGVTATVNLRGTFEVGAEPFDSVESTLVAESHSGYV